MHNVLRDKSQEITNAVSDFINKLKDAGVSYTQLAEVEGLIKVIRVPTPQGHEHTIFLRQHSVLLFPVIRVRDAYYTLLAEEFRTGAYEKLTGLAAGSMDHGGESIQDTARREIHEELPIDLSWIKKISLIYTGNSANFVSPGNSNEQVFPVRIDLHLPQGVEIESLDKQRRGVVDEGEDIVSHVREITENLFDELHTTGEKLALFGILRDLAKEKLACIEDSEEDSQ